MSGYLSLKQFDLDAIMLGYGGSMAAAFFIGKNPNLQKMVPGSDAGEMPFELGWVSKGGMEPV